MGDQGMICEFCGGPVDENAISGEKRSTGLVVGRYWVCWKCNNDRRWSKTTPTDAMTQPKGEEVNGY